MATTCRAGRLEIYTHALRSTILGRRFATESSAFVWEISGGVGLTPDQSRTERARGCLLGQLAGDALGSAVEFKDSSDIADAYPEGVRHLKDGGTWNLIAGQPTDDSEMALALARSLAAAGKYERRQVAEAYIRWWRSEPFDIGMTTATGIEALARGRRVTSGSQANGALMRISPVGIFAAGDPARAASIAARDALLTHPHPVCQAANAAYAAAIAVGVAGGDRAEMWQAAFDFSAAGSAYRSGAEPIRARLEAARSGPPEEYQSQMGWVLTAFQNAFFLLLSDLSLEDAVVWTVGCGGDTDTNAAIAGALIGALQGELAFPSQWRDTVLSCRPDADSGTAHPRPEEYWPVDAFDLADRLVVAGLVQQDHSRYRWNVKT